MKSVLTGLLLVLMFNSTAQSSAWTAQYRVKNTFEIGDEQTYEVTEFHKASSLFIIKKSETNSLVRFQIVDTLAGGYWMKYSVLNNEVNRQADSSTYIIAALSVGIEQYIYVKDGHFLFDSASYRQNQQIINERLQQIVAEKQFRNKISVFIQRLEAEINEANDISIVFGPLLLMYQYFNADMYKKFMVNTKSSITNIANQHLFSGDMGRKWESTGKDSVVKLSRIFTADPVPAARYYKPIYRSILKASGIKKKLHHRLYYVQRRIPYPRHARSRRNRLCYERCKPCRHNGSHSYNIQRPGVSLSRITKKN